MRDLRGGLIRTTLGCLLAGSMVLTGCAAKQEANTTLPPTSAAPTPELPLLGPADFPVPDEARTKDAAGAEAFLRYYVELLNRQQALPAGQAIRDLSPKCTTCLRIARAFEEAAAAGWTYQGGELTLNDVIEPRLDGDTAKLIFGVRVEALSILDSARAPVPNGEQALMPNAGSGMTLAWSDQDESWLAAGLTIG
ncbi:hypothetical protein [Blastococcus sp. SYSU DS0539]